MAKDLLLGKIGDYLRKKAKTKYKSNVEFGDACNVAEGSIRRIYAGKQNLSFKMLERMCEALDVKMSEMLKELGK
jgi:DNA-binding Xre family transcriptional regulator